MFLEPLVFVAIFAPIFYKNKNINGWLTLNMTVKASNLLSGEFLDGWWWGIMVLKKQTALRPSVRVFSMGCQMGNVFWEKFL